MSGTAVKTPEGWVEDREAVNRTFRHLSTGYCVVVVPSRYNSLRPWYLYGPLYTDGYWLGWEDVDSAWTVMRYASRLISKHAIRRL